MMMMNYVRRKVWIMCLLDLLSMMWYTYYLTIIFNEDIHTIATIVLGLKFCIIPKFCCFNWAYWLKCNISMTSVSFSPPLIGNFSETFINSMTE
uniref:Ovule protein n=1 Tax=Heterorhabditis bacteriophora TaxID=37862 RepID=A0A1I7WL57_HETBA